MLKLLFIFCVVVVQTNCDNHGEHVHIDAMIQKYLKMEKETWDMLNDQNYQNNIRRIRFMHRQFLSDPFLSSNASVDERFKRSDFHEGSSQWAITANYLLGNDSESVSKNNALAHVREVFHKDYSEYWNSKEIDYFNILRKVRLMVMKD